MVVYVMTKGTSGHHTVRSRHVDVQFPAKNELITSSPVSSAEGGGSSVCPVPPTSQPRSARTSSSKYLNNPAPQSLIPDEWMATLVQYVAALKKNIYEDAREELSEAIKVWIPLQLRAQVSKHSDLRLGGAILYGAHVSDTVAAHETLTRQVSTRRSQRDVDPESGGGAFLNCHYKHDEDSVCGVDGDSDSKLTALVSNSLFQQAHIILNKERNDRVMLERQCLEQLLEFKDDEESEHRGRIAIDEIKAWNRIASAEVGEYLAQKRRSQDNVRAAAIRHSTEQLKGEKDTLRREVLQHAIESREEVERSRQAHAAVVDAMMEELPQQPNADNMDAEVARLLLKQRREEQPNYFPDFS